jgi:hypothetical protein
MIDELSIAWEGFSNLIGKPLRDSLMPYLQTLLSWVATHPEEIRRIATKVADDIARGLTSALDVVDKLVRRLEDLGVALDNIKDVAGTSSVFQGAAGETNSFTSAAKLPGPGEGAFTGAGDAMGQSLASRQAAAAGGGETTLRVVVSSEMSTAQLGEAILPHVRYVSGETQKQLWAAIDKQKLERVLRRY